MSWSNGSENVPTIKVLIVDDHVLVAQTLRLALLEAEAQAIILPDPSPESFPATLRRLHPDVVVLDLDLGLWTERAGLRLIGPALDSGAAVMVLTGVRDRHVLAACIEAGAAGVVGKEESLETVVDKIFRAAHGAFVTAVTEREQLLAELRFHRAADAKRLRPFETLTPKEEEVLAALCAGSSPASIAEIQYVSITTVRGHINAILRKLGVSSQLAATAMARHAGWVSSERRPDSVHSAVGGLLVGN